MKPQPGPGRSRRKIRNFLIYGEYQLHYAAQMVLVSVALTVGLGGLVYHENRVASRVVDLRALDPSDVEAQVLSSAFHRSDHRLLIGLVAFGVVLSLVLAAWQIVTTHRVAGPLYYIAHQTRRIRDGFLGSLHPLRKGDMLHGFFETFREMQEAMRERAKQEAEQFAGLAEQAEKAGLEAMAAELRGLSKQRQDSLRASARDSRTGQ